MAVTTDSLRIADRAALKAALKRPHPVLIHLNGDTTWLIQLPYPADVKPPPGRSRFNILLDPWLQGPQSDVASWFSTQWHVVAPSVQTIKELNELLAEVEQDSAPESSGGVGEESGSGSRIDVVALSHEFTDHCHEATLRELPPCTPVFAPEKAADLVRSWGHYEKVITTPAFSAAEQNWRETLSVSPLPSWVGVGRVVTAGNALYYHSAIMIAYTSHGGISESDGSPLDAIIYSPHGIKGSDLQPVKAAGINTLALLHGLHDVRIWMTKQLNLGALNGLEAVNASGAKYWIATHDEVKKGGGFIAPLLRRTRYTLADAVKTESQKAPDKVPDYEFVELGSGDGLILV
jgi:hypothetical protein